MRSGGGGANAILVRGETIAAHAWRRVRTHPERRVMHAVRLEPSGLWVANIHASKNRRERPRADAPLAIETLLRWGHGAPGFVFGGDLNVRDPRPYARFTVAGGHWLDHVLVRGLEADGDAEIPERGTLSDHEPVVVPLRFSA